MERTPLNRIHNLPKVKVRETRLCLCKHLHICGDVYAWLCSAWQDECLWLRVEQYSLRSACPLTVSSHARHHD